MKKLLITFLLLSGVSFAQSKDTVFTAVDSIIVADIDEQLQEVDKYIEALQKEYERVDNIKAYLLNRKAVLLKKKKK